jgi:hypothetical protein
VRNKLLAVVAAAAEETDEQDFTCDICDNPLIGPCGNPHCLCGGKILCQMHYNEHMEHPPASAVNLSRYTQQTIPKMLKRRKVGSAQQTSSFSNESSSSFAGRVLRERKGRMGKK